MKILIAIAFLIPVLASAGEPSCHNTNEKRIVVGKEPTANALYAGIRDIDLGAWKNRFWNETFTYVGDARTLAGKTYKVGYLRTVWGESCRATPRLLIFDDSNNYLGQYYGIMSAPTKIIRATLYFSFKPEEGNTLDLEKGPPKQVWLDGDNPKWRPASNKVHQRT